MESTLPSLKTIPSSPINPLGQDVLVYADPPITETPDGVHIPDGVSRYRRTGLVVSVGTSVQKALVPGDHVYCFTSFSDKARISLPGLDDDNWFLVDEFDVAGTIIAKKKKLHV